MLGAPYTIDFCASHFQIVTPSSATERHHPEFRSRPRSGPALRISPPQPPRNGARQPRDQLRDSGEVNVRAFQVRRSRAREG